MGTLFRIVLYAEDEALAKRAAGAAFARIKALDHILSDYQTDSELRTVCREAAEKPVKVGNELFTVLSRSHALARRTDGAFDVTVGPLSKLWRRARRQHQLPSPERLEKALALVGHEKLTLDEEHRTVRLAHAGMLLDLGGIAKGYAADEAMSVLKQHGIESAMVAASGDIVVSNAPPGEEGWKIGIEPLTPSGERQPPERTPEAMKNEERRIENEECQLSSIRNSSFFILHSSFRSGGPPLRVLLLKNAGVSTSGDAEQYVEINGHRYSHIVDPRTGVGLPGQSSVTVVAPNGITSDSLATALSVLGPRKGLKLSDATQGAAALFVEIRDGKRNEYQSERWNDVPKDTTQRDPV